MAAAPLHQPRQLEGDIGGDKGDNASLSLPIASGYSSGTDHDHPSVLGLLGDKQSPTDGIVETRRVTRLLEDARIPCCVAGVVALQHYNVSRVRVSDVIICVPTATMSQAKAMLDARTHEYMLLAPDMRADAAENAAQASWPRFKVVGVSVVIALAPAESLCLPLATTAISATASTTTSTTTTTTTPGPIVRGPRSGLPFPSLPALAQSLLDAANFSDLEDLVDGMDLTAEWAAQEGLRVTDDVDPFTGWSRRQAWERLLARKQARMGAKYDPRYYATRFVRRGSRPRLRL